MKMFCTLFAIFGVLGCADGSINEDSSTEFTTNPNIEGLNSLYMGHSYFRRQAEAMGEYADIAGITGHQSTTIFHGGYKGSAAAIWEDVVPGSRATVQEYLDTGDIQMLGMTIFIDSEASDTEVTHIDNQVQGLKNWIEYALSLIHI